MTTKEPEYREHIVDTRRKGEHWVAHWALPDHSTPEYQHPPVRPKVRCSGGYLEGPYKSEGEAIEAAHREIDWNLTR